MKPAAATKDRENEQKSWEFLSVNLLSGRACAEKREREREYSCSLVHSEVYLPGALLTEALLASSCHSSGSFGMHLADFVFAMILFGGTQVRRAPFHLTARVLTPRRHHPLLLTRRMWRRGGRRRNYCYYRRSNGRHCHRGCYCCFCSNSSNRRRRRRRTAFENNLLLLTLLRQTKSKLESCRSSFMLLMTSVRLGFHHGENLVQNAAILVCISSSSARSSSSSRRHRGGGGSIQQGYRFPVLKLPSSRSSSITISQQPVGLRLLLPRCNVTPPTLMRRSSSDRHSHLLFSFLLYCLLAKPKARQTPKAAHKLLFSLCFFLKPQTLQQTSKHLTTKKNNNNQHTTIQQ